MKKTYYILITLVLVAIVIFMAVTLNKQTPQSSKADGTASAPGVLSEQGAGE